MARSMKTAASMRSGAGAGAGKKKGKTHRKKQLATKRPREISKKVLALKKDQKRRKAEEEAALAEEDSSFVEEEEEEEEEEGEADEEGEGEEGAGEDEEEEGEGEEGGRQEGEDDEGEGDHQGGGMSTSLLRLDREYEEEQDEYVPQFHLHTLTDRELLLKVYAQQQQILVGQTETKGGQTQTNLLLAGLSNRVKALEDNRRVVPSSAGSNKYTLSIRF